MLGCLQPGHHFGKVTLTIPRHTRHADNFASPHLQVDVGEKLHPVTLEMHLRYREQHVAGRQFGASRHNVDFSTHHQFGQPAHIGLTPSHRTSHLATPHHRDAIRDVNNFAQLVAHKHHRLTHIGHRANGDKKLFNFGRRQKRSGFVQQQNFSTLIQRLNDFYPLSLARRQLADYCSRV